MNIALPVVIAFGLLSQPVLAATQTEADAALKAAQAEEAKALAAQAAWTPTEALLDQARKAIAAQNWDGAKAAADEALAMAARSIAQATEQKSLWQDAVLR